MSKEFSGAVFGFCNQAVAGGFMSLHKVVSSTGYIQGEGKVAEAQWAEVFEQFGVVARLFMAKYLQRCWHDWNQERDEFVVKSMDEIMRLGGMKHKACAMDFVWQCCGQVFEGVSRQLCPSTTTTGSSAENRYEESSVRLTIRLATHSQQALAEAHFAATNPSFACSDKCNPRAADPCDKASPGPIDIKFPESECTCNCVVKTLLSAVNSIPSTE